MEHIQSLFSWQDNLFLDLWSIVHLFWGAIGGLLCLLILKRVPFRRAFLLAITFVVLWEYGEYLYGILESVPNIGTDVVLGQAGFLLGYKLPHKLRVDPYVFLIPLIIVVILATYVGWINYVAR